jgi:hypothetical protein
LASSLKLAWPASYSQAGLWALHFERNWIHLFNLSDKRCFYPWLHAIEHHLNIYLYYDWTFHAIYRSASMMLSYDIVPFDN